ncbi:DUF4222 domain-containing protein [Escherichia coli]|uniref:DUF4222 domain-containing protein n=1 Tax=Escherichia coli TaxID=562 RepID=UPI00165E3967|nr:DUF4222 domain-containing protein [Escherichia coli]HAZ7389791.1 DUF4222 domain-containing protein [Escherichia coli]
MFRIIFPNTWYVDHHGTPCKILRSTHNKVHYIRKGRTCIASMFRFNHDFEPVNKADADRIKAFPGTPHFLHLLNEIFA